MDTLLMQKLLDKYFEGKTTLEEENTLRNYFTGRSHDIDASLAKYKGLFSMLKDSTNLTFDLDAVNNKVLEAISLDEKQINPPAPKIGIKRLMIAATIAIAIGITGIQLYFRQHRLTDTYNDPKLAYAETRKALLLISDKLNKGMEPLENIEKINTGSNQLKKLEKMDKSMEMLNLVSFINQSTNLKK